MSSEEDSPVQVFHLDSSRLVLLFEEMQAVGFPMSFLENNVDRIKKGSPSVIFAIYKHLYRTFRQVFIEYDVILDNCISGGKVADRENFARQFHTVMLLAFNIPLGLPIYQYLIPGHPVAKIDELILITKTLRDFMRNPDKYNRPNRLASFKSALPSSTAASGVAETRTSLPKHSAATEPHLDFHHAPAQPLHLARIDTPEAENIPWRVVREVELDDRQYKSDPNRHVPLQSEEDSDEEEQSPDEGFKSRNTSSLKSTALDYLHLQSRSVGSSLRRSQSSPLKALGIGDRSSPVRKEKVMDNDGSGVRQVLARLEQTETVQNQKFRSIEDRLIRMEHDLNGNLHKLQHSTADRLSDHESRITNLERKFISSELVRSRSDLHSTQPVDRSPMPPIETAAKHHHAASSPPHSPPPSPAHKERHDSHARSSSIHSVHDRNSQHGHSRAASLSRSFIHLDNQKTRDMLRDSGIHASLRYDRHAAEAAEPHKTEEHASSSVHNEPATSSDHHDHHHDDHHGHTGHSAHNRHHSHHSEHSPHRKHVSPHHARIRGRSESRESSIHRILTGKHKHSVGTDAMHEIHANGHGKEHHVEETGALIDLNERIQLRLKERIRAAEETINACMETIKRDYVLLRKHN